MTAYSQATLDLFAKYHFIPQDDGTVFLAFKYTGYGDPTFSGCGSGHSWPTGNPDDGDGATQWAIYGWGYTVNSDSPQQCVPTYYATLEEYFQASPLDMSRMQFFEAPTNNPSYFEYASYESVAKAVKGSFNGELGYFLDPNLIGFVESHPSSAWVDFREGLLKQFIIPAVAAAVGAEYSAGSSEASAAGASTGAVSAVGAASGAGEDFGLTGAEGGVDTVGAQSGVTGAVSDTTTFADTGAGESFGMTGNEAVPAADMPAVVTPAAKDGLIAQLSKTVGSVSSAEKLFNQIYTAIKGPSGAPLTYQRTSAPPGGSGSALADSGLGANITPIVKQLAIPAALIAIAWFVI